MFRRVLWLVTALGAAVSLVGVLLALNAESRENRAERAERGPLIQSSEIGFEVLSRPRIIASSPNESPTPWKVAVGVEEGLVRGRPVDSNLLCWSDGPSVQDQCYSLEVGVLEDRCLYRSDWAIELGGIWNRHLGLLVGTADSGDIGDREVVVTTSAGHRIKAAIHAVEWATDPARQRPVGSEARAPVNDPVALHSVGVFALGLTEKPQLVELVDRSKSLIDVARPTSRYPHYGYTFEKGSPQLGEARFDYKGMCPG